MVRTQLKTDMESAMHLLNEDELLNCRFTKVSVGDVISPDSGSEIWF